MAYTPVTISDEQLITLESEHEDILKLEGGERAPWVVVVRRPKRQETIAYKQHAQKNRETANEALLRRIIVAPTGAELEKQIDRWPFLCDAVADAESFKDFLGLTVSNQVK